MHDNTKFENTLFTRRGMVLYFLILVMVLSLGVIAGSCGYIMYYFLVMW